MPSGLAHLHREPASRPGKAWQNGNSIWILLIFQRINGLTYGKIYGKPQMFPWRSWDFPVIFPLNQSIERSCSTVYLKVPWPPDIEQKIYHPNKWTHFSLSCWFEHFLTRFQPCFNHQWVVWNMYFIYIYILFFHSVGNVTIPIDLLISGWWWLEHDFDIFPQSWEFHHPVDGLKFFRG